MGTGASGTWGHACLIAYEIECQTEGLGQCLFQTEGPADALVGYVVEIRYCILLCRGSFYCM